MPGIIGKKIGMTSIYNEEGKNQPCTVIEAGPCVVTQIRTQEKDGYEAVQIGYGDKKESNVTDAMAGHFNNAKTSPKAKVLEVDGYEGDIKVGGEIKVDIFEEGEFVDISGTTKGKGFQGVVKRHGFHGVGDMTHGQADQQRAGGSIGASSDPSRVFKGMRMPGRAGGSRVKAQNLEVLKLIPEKNIIVLKGSVPGAKGSYVIVEK